MAEIPEEIRKQLEASLAGIAKLFKAPLITLIVRAGGNSSGDLVLTNDNPTLVLEALRNRMVAEAAKWAEDGQAPEATNQGEASNDR